MVRIACKETLGTKVWMGVTFEGRQYHTFHNKHELFNDFLEMISVAAAYLTSVTRVVQRAYDETPDTKVWM